MLLCITFGLLVAWDSLLCDEYHIILFIYLLYKSNYLRHALNFNESLCV